MLFKTFLSIVTNFQEVALVNKSAIISFTMSNAAKAEYYDLIDAWWKTAEVLSATPPADATRVNWHAYVFEKILIQCGWSVQEWNDTINNEKKIQGTSQ